MARLSSEITFVGSLGNLSAYRMKGSDKIILRRKGGGSKKKIKTSASCINIRRINAEFGGRSGASKLIRSAMGPVKALADFNFTGHLNALLQPIQELDMTNELGKRNIHLSKNPKLLQGFSLNKNRTFDSVIRTPVSYSLDRESRSATVTIPAIVPGINFFPLPYHPLYSFVLTLGIVPDLNYADIWKCYKAPDEYDKFRYALTQSNWLHIGTNADEITLKLNSSDLPPDDNHTLILSIGIRYGTVSDDQQMQQVAGVGSAKILGTAGKARSLFEH